MQCDKINNHYQESTILLHYQYGIQKKIVFVFRDCHQQVNHNYIMLSSDIVFYIDLIPSTKFGNWESRIKYLFIQLLCIVHTF